MNECKKVAVFSNYSWAYISSAVAKKCFPVSDITLITTNIADVANKHDFGMKVIERSKLKSQGNVSLGKRVRYLKSMNFDAAVIDYGFNPDVVFEVLGLGVRKIFVSDLSSKETVRLITRAMLLKMVLEKLPYFLNKALIQISKKLRLSVSLGLPSEMSIETTTICNLKCKGCPTGLGQLDRASMHIPRELFKKIIEKNRVNFKYLDIIYPFIFGEPLLNNEIFGYIRELRGISSPYTRIELHTNGNIKHSKESALMLLGSGMDLINISLDGTDKATYENFRRGGDFELVCEFVKNITRTKKEMGLIRPEIVMQMIVTKYSEDQIDEFKMLKENLGADRVTFKNFFHEFTGLSDEEGYSIAPSKKELALGKEEKEEIINRKNNMCGWAYRAISIMCNGNIAPCCIDFNTSLLGGLSIDKSTINRVWNSAKYRRFRRDMLRGKIPMCNKCFFS